MRYATTALIAPISAVTPALGRRPPAAPGPFQQHNLPTSSEPEVRLRAQPAIHDGRLGDEGRAQ